MISRFELHLQILQYAAHFPLLFGPWENYYHNKGFINEIVKIVYSQFLSWDFFSLCLKGLKVFVPHWNWLPR